MKRTLFSCCVLLSALAVPLLSARTSRAEAGCGVTVGDLNGIGHCAVPGIYADTYGECFWEDDDCDRANDSAAVVTATDTVCDEDVTDYWYDGETGEYYNYEFAGEDETVAETLTETTAEPAAETVAETTAETDADIVDTAEEALDDLFEICETEVATTGDDKVEGDAGEQTTAACTGTCDADDDYRCDYGGDEDYGYDYGYSYENEDDYGYDDHDYHYSYEDEYDYAYDDYEYWDTYASDEADATVDQNDEEAARMYVEDGLDYRDESYVEQVCKQDASEAEAPVDEAATAPTDEVAEEAGQDEAYDYYTEYGDYGYDYEEYEYHYGEAYDDAPSQTVDWDDAVESSMSDETVSEEPACDETVTEAPTCEEPAETARENAWEDEHYWGYEHYDYGYGYDTEAYECECEEQEKYDANEVASGIEETAGGSDAPAVNEAQAAVSPQKLQREAVLSLARTLNRIGTSLQKISQTLTDMAAQEVAVQTTGDTVER